MPPVGFEPKILAIKRTHTYVLNRAATGTKLHNVSKINWNKDRDLLR